jgi:hypothetical protein
VVIVRASITDIDRIAARILPLIGRSRPKLSAAVTVIGRPRRARAPDRLSRSGTQAGFFVLLPGGRPRPRLSGAGAADASGAGPG